MRLQVKGRNVEVSDSIRRYAEEKLGKLERQLADPTQVELELAVEHNPSIADEPRRRGDDLDEGPDAARPRDARPSYEASIDQLVEKLERQVKRYREKRSRRETGPPGQRATSPNEPDFTAEQLERMIVKSKQFDLQPLTPDEATLQLELSGTTSSSSATTTTGKTNVVYRRRDGGLRADRAAGVSRGFSAAQGAAARAARGEARPGHRLDRRRRRRRGGPADALTPGGSAARPGGRFPHRSAGRVRRPRRWRGRAPRRRTGRASRDAVATRRAPSWRETRCTSWRCPTGRCSSTTDVPDGVAARSRTRSRRRSQPPYRAEAVRAQRRRVWAVGASEADRGASCVPGRSERVTSSSCGRATAQGLRDRPTGSTATSWRSRSRRSSRSAADEHPGA